MDEPRRKNQVTTADIASTPSEHDRTEAKRDEPGTWRERYEDARARAGDVARDDRSEPHDHGEGGDPDLSRDPQGPRDVDPAEQRVELMPSSDIRDLKTRWTSVQATFVDTPREAVASADRLVAETIQRLAQSFANGRSTLEQQWDRGDEVSTEDLRQALRRYRSFFDRLLSV
jgi:hypothetical protein